MKVGYYNKAKASLFWKLICLSSDPLEVLSHSVCGPHRHNKAVSKGNRTSGDF